MAEDTVKAVAQAMGYDFEDPTLLEDALTHSSFANEKPALSRGDNERLEFLGDAVLQWIVSTLLWERFPGASAGEMTRRRADLVCEDGLADLARSIGVGHGLRLGKGEERSGGREKPRLLASALEACVAAVYLDAGSQQTVDVCRRLFLPRIDQRDPGARDFKTRVQETLQRRGCRPPRYEVRSASGPDHERRFEVAIMVNGDTLASGQGRSKLEAEQAAAERALETLQAEPEQGADVASDAPPAAPEAE